MEGDFERIEKLLAMILLHDMQDAPQGDRAVALSRAGLTHGEIAALLGAPAASIKQQIYKARRGTKGRARRPLKTADSSRRSKRRNRAIR